MRIGWGNCGDEKDIGMILLAVGERVVSDLAAVFRGQEREKRVEEVEVDEAPALKCRDELLRDEPRIDQREQCDLLLQVEELPQ